MRVLQSGRRLDLGQEPLGAEHRRQVGLEDLDRHLAVVPEVFGQVHRGHAALAQLPLEAVAVGEACPEALKTHGETPGQASPTGR
jgi:hypothetical protein